MIKRFSASTIWNIKYSYSKNKNKDALACNQLLFLFGQTGRFLTALPSEQTKFRVPSLQVALDPSSHFHQRGFLSPAHRRREPSAHLGHFLSLQGCSQGVGVEPSSQVNVGFPLEHLGRELSAHRGLPQPFFSGRLPSEHDGAAPSAQTALGRQPSEQTPGQ